MIKQCCCFVVTSQQPNYMCTCNPSSKYLMFYNVVWITASTQMHAHATRPYRQHTNTHMHLFWQALLRFLTSSPTMVGE